MTTLIKEIYKNVDKTKYFKSVGSEIVEVSEQVFINLFKMSLTISNSSESYFDRTVITRQVEII